MGSNKILRSINRSIKNIGNYESVHELQERMLNAQLFLATLVSIFLYFFALIPVLQIRAFDLAIIYTLFYCWLLVITIFRKLPYWFRTASWLFFLFAFGVINLFISGLNVDAGLFMLTFVVMTSLLFNIRVALVSFVMSFVAIIVMGILVLNGKLNFLMNLPQSNPLLWIIGGIIFLLLGGISIFSISSIMRGLVRKINKASKLAENLTKAHNIISESEIRFRSLIENSTDLVAILRVDGQIGYTSPSVSRLLGYHPDEINDKNVLSFLHAEDQALVVAALTPGVPEEQIGSFIELRLRHKDGSWRWFEANGFELRTTPVINGTVVNCRDITDRKNVEALLQASLDNLEQQVFERTEELLSTSARLKELVLHSPAVIYATALDDDWKSIQVSDNVEDLLGYSASQVLKEDGFWDQHIHPEDKSQIRAIKGKIVDEKKNTCKYRLLHKDGKYRWIQDDMQLVVEADDRRINLVGSWVDITKQIEAERATLSTQDRYHGLYESMSDAFVRVDMAGKIIEFNKSYADMLGYLPEELHQLTYFDLTPPKWHAMETDIVTNYIIPRGFSDVYEKEYIHKDGTVFSIELRTSLTSDEDGNPESMWAIIRDVTQRKKTEASLQNAKEELEKRVAERTIELVESRERLRYLTRDIITTQEDERRSVSRELHDEVGQVFVTLKYSLDTAMGEVPDGHQELKDRLESAMQITDASMQLMRDLSHRLRPPILEVGGIHISLEELCQDVSGKTNLIINYQGVEIPGLPNEIAISLYRVVQESLTNILKYADAKKVLIRLRYLRGKIQLSVRDDGSGIKDLNTRGTGLLGLQERLHLLGGDLKIESPSGQGVHLRASVPWSKDLNEKK